MTQLQEYELIRNFMTDTSKTLNSITKVPNYQHDFNLLFKVYNKIWDTEEKRQNKNDIYFTLDFNTTNACTLSFSTEDGTYLEFIGEEDTAIHSFYSVLVQYLEMHKKRGINVALELYEFSKRYSKVNTITEDNYLAIYRNWDSIMSVLNAIKYWSAEYKLIADITISSVESYIAIEHSFVYTNVPVEFNKTKMFLTDGENMAETMYDCLTQFIKWYRNLPKNAQ